MKQTEIATNGIQIRCNVLIRHHFPVHIRGIHKRNTYLCMAVGCAVHHLACIVQPMGYTGMGQVLIFPHIWLLEYRASENVTPGAVVFHVNMFTIRRKVSVVAFIPSDSTNSWKWTTGMLKFQNHNNHSYNNQENVLMIQNIRNREKIESTIGFARQINTGTCQTCLFAFGLRNAKKKRRSKESIPLTESFLHVTKLIMTQKSHHIVQGRKEVKMSIA